MYVIYIYIYIYIYIKHTYVISLHAPLPPRAAVSTRSWSRVCGLAEVSAAATSTCRYVCHSKYEGQPSCVFV